MILLIERYNESNANRKSELDFVLQKNLENSLIQEIVIFYQSDYTPLESQKINSVLVGSRLKMKDPIIWANQYRKEKICIMANCDIFYDETLELANNIDLTQSLICLTRWNWSPRNSTELMIHPHTSQDSWIFKSGNFPVIGDYYFGILGCDNAFANDAREYVEIYNPSMLIKSYHFHQSGIRNYNASDRLLRGYTYVYPSQELIPAKLERYSGIINSYK